MFGKLLGEIAALPARSVEAAADVADTLTDGVLRDFGLEDIQDAASSIGDAVSEGIEEVLDG